MHKGYIMYSSCSLLLFLLGAFSGIVLSIIPDGCQTEFTNTYSYTNFHPIAAIAKYVNYSTIINFSVRAASDAHVLLSPTSLLVYSTPVYEIVLGAGQNSFSVIRGKERRRTMNHTKTPSILSPYEERGFWIRLSNNLIEIGKAERNEVILYARETSLLNVQYFCFSTWYQVMGKWTYGCPTDTAKTTEKQTSASETLRKDMLTFYNPYTRPVVSEEQITAVQIDLQPINVKLDEKTSVFTVDGIMKMNWNDEKLRWDPGSYQNISVLRFTKHEIWQPDIVLTNAVGHGSGLFGETPVIAKSDGSVYWSSPVHLEAWCSSDLRNWPRDQHTCRLTLSFASKHQALEMMIDNNTMGASQSTGSEWNIISFLTETAWIPVPELPEPVSGINIKISIQRNNASYQILLLGPLIAVILMTLLTFWIPATAQYKMFCSCCGMIILSKFILEFENLLPSTGYAVPPILSAYCSGLIAMAISLHISVIVIALTRYTFTCTPPACVCRVLSSKYFHKFLLLSSITSTENYSYTHLHEGSTADSGSSQHEMKEKEKLQQYWVVLATVVDRITSVIYAVYLSILLATHN